MINFFSILILKIVPGVGIKVKVGSSVGFRVDVEIIVGSQMEDTQKKI